MLKEKLIKCWNDIDSCKLCPTKHEKVFIRGSGKADIVFVGFSPTELDIKAKKPFSNGDGHILDRILTAAGYEGYAKAYMNAVFCCAGDDVEQQTVANCKAHSSNLLRILNPKIIIVMGKKACMAMFPSIKFKAGVGFTHIEYPESTIYLGYNPGYVRKVPSKEPDVLASYISIREQINV